MRRTANWQMQPDALNYWRPKEIGLGFDRRRRLAKTLLAETETWQKLLFFYAVSELLYVM